jgi:hypothetical protein
LTLLPNLSWGSLTDLSWLRDRFLCLVRTAPRQGGRYDDAQRDESE